MPSGDQWETGPNRRQIRIRGQQICRDIFCLNDRPGRKAWKSFSAPNSTIEEVMKISPIVGSFVLAILTVAPTTCALTTDDLLQTLFEQQVQVSSKGQTNERNPKNILADIHEPNHWQGMVKIKTTFTTLRNFGSQALRLNCLYLKTAEFHLHSSPIGCKPFADYSELYQALHWQLPSLYSSKACLFS